MPTTPGTYRGKHFSEWTSTARQLIREGDLVAAERLLLGMVKATEAESRANGWGVTPWPYEQLAITYRKWDDLASELGVLERYDRQKKAPGAKAAKLAARLQAVRVRTPAEPKTGLAGGISEDSPSVLPIAARPRSASHGSEVDRAPARDD